MKSRTARFTLYRQTKPRGRWKASDRPEHDPNWIVSLALPGAKRRRVTAENYEICAPCLAIAGNPVEGRPNCDCQKAVKKWASELLETELHLLRTGEIQKLQEIRAPKRLAPIARVAEVYELRGPKDANARTAALRSIVEQATGKRLEDCQWSELTRSLLMTWAEIRQEAGRRGWLGLGKRSLPDDGWPKLREAYKVGTLPALDKSAVLQANTTIQSYWTQAKSIFGADSRTVILRELMLPDCTPGTAFFDFLKTSFKDLRTPKGHKEFPAEVYEQLWNAAESLKEHNLALWVVGQLLWRTGMRPIEILRAAPAWLSADAGTGDFIRIPSTKKGNEREWPIEADLVTAIKAVMNKDRLIGQKHVTAARLLIYSEHSLWMRSHGIEGTQTNYKFRHFVLQRIRDRDGLDATALAAGHRTTDIAESVYTKPGGKIRILTRDELRPAERTKKASA